MISKCFINQNGHQLGPWTHAEILNEIKSGRLAWTDYIFDDQKKDWALLFEYGAFSEYIKAWADQPQKMVGQYAGQAQTGNPSKNATDPAQDKKLEEEWFVLKGDDTKYGPFCYLELVKRLQEKSVHEFDYVWTARLDGWTRISEASDFSPEKIKELKKVGSNEAAKVFFRRRHARALYGASILIHDNRAVWKGQSCEISPGGAGLLVESDEIQIGQVLFLHFKAGDGVPPFNAVCSIVSKHTEKGKEVRYGVKFTSISRSIQAAIKKYTDQAA